MNNEEKIKDLLRQIYDSWFGAKEKPRMGFTSHTVVELEKAGYEIVKKGQWRDISTALKDGTEILLITKTWWTPDNGNHRWIYSKIKQGSWNGVRYSVNGLEPTHWQLLPEPPKE